MPFTRMDESTAAEWMNIGREVAKRQANMPALIKSMLRQLEAQVDGFETNQLVHALQTATRAVRDNASEEMIVAVLAVLKAGGRAAFIGSGQTPPVPMRTDVQSLRPKVGRSRAHIERIAALATSGAVRVPEVKLFALSEAAAAHKISEGRHFRGKLVFKVR